MYDQLRSLTIRTVRVNADGTEDPGRMSAAKVGMSETAQNERGSRVNRMVLDHVTRTCRYSGEIKCPECRSGNICYLVQMDRHTIIECSTPGCVRWDSRVAL